MSHSGLRQVLYRVADRSRSALPIQKTTFAVIVTLVGHFAWSNQEPRVMDVLAQIEALSTTNVSKAGAQIQKRFKAQIEPFKKEEMESLLSAMLVRLPILFMSTPSYNLERHILFDLTLSCLAARPSDENHQRLLLLYHLAGLSEIEKTRIIELLLMKRYSNQNANIATFIDYLKKNIDPNETIYRLIESIGKLKATEATRAVASYVLRRLTPDDVEGNAAASKTLAILVRELDRKCQSVFLEKPDRPEH